MKAAIVAFALGIAFPGAPCQTVGGTTADTAAIRVAIDNWDRGWRVFDAHLATQDFAADADWTNAFGKSQKGQSAVEKYLAALFVTPEIRSRQSTPSSMTIRFVRPDVAVVASDRQTSGQKTASGDTYPTRKTHDLRVFVKEHGRWLITSHQVMDEKDVRP